MTLFADDISIEEGGIFSWGGNAGSGRITNPGFFRLNGKLLTGGNSERLGRFILSGPSVIDLGGSSILNFAHSSGTVWGGNWGVSALLTVSNWNGSLSGGGNTQLSFGTNSAGLTTSQIARIRFINPDDLPAGTYRARILPTGEVVPATDVIFYTINESTLVLNWFGPHTLQTAMEVEGPFIDLSDATSPFTNTFLSPRQFFRIKP